MQKKITLLSQLLLDLEADMGTSDTTILVLNSLKNSLSEMKSQTDAVLHAQLQEITHVVCETTPKFGILNFYFQQLLSSFENERTSKQAPLKFLLDKIDAILNQITENKNKLLEFAEKIDVEGKTILIHDHSHTVHSVLQHLRSLKKNFQIIVAEQEHEKTQQNIEILHDANIPFRVIPSYMLSHTHDKIDMAFFGALTLKNSMDFVMDPGSHGVISELHTTKTPLYCFLKTSKFSLWESKNRGEVLYHKHIRTHCTKCIEYERVKYSHDRVPAELFFQIVTNEGIFTPSKLKELFEKKFKEAKLHLSGVRQ